MHKKWLTRLLYSLIGIMILIVIGVLYAYNIIPHRSYHTDDFQIETLFAHRDENNNGVDDLEDIYVGAKHEIDHMPTYRSAYYEGGYPPVEEGVCTDVIWRALKYAGYDFKSMIDEDIQKNVNVYPRVQGLPDPNIDFRRVPNVATFLARHTLSLPIELEDPTQWQRGDIIVFSDTHIGILSEKRNASGFPFLLHNGNLPVGEEDCLKREAFLKGISGHYRFILEEE